MKNIFNDIKDFVSKFAWKLAYRELDNEGKSQFIKFRIGLIKEELNELVRAEKNKDAEEVVDAAQDIIVTAAALTEILNVDNQKAWDEVHAANMRKVKGHKKGRDNPYNMPDANKPEDWVGPNHEGNHGYLKELWKEDKQPELVEGHEISSMRELREAFKHNNKIVAEGEIVELRGVSFEATDDVVFGELSQRYVDAEHKWYYMQDRNVNSLADIYGYIPKAWKNVMNENGDINSNYGYCVYSQDNGSQYDNVIKELKRNPDSRRATIIYQTERMHSEYNLNGMNDFICTNAVTYMNRNNKLDVIVQMRSNDAIFGYKNDRQWQIHLQKKIAKELGIECGRIIWQVQSMHIYDEHRHLIK